MFVRGVMTELGFITEEKQVIKTEKLYTCTECGFKVQADMGKIQRHCAAHKIVSLKKEVQFIEPVKQVVDTAGRGFDVLHTGTAVFTSEEQADELCCLINLSADYYMPTLAEIEKWEGPGKYNYSVRSYGGKGETNVSMTFTKEKS